METKIIKSAEFKGGKLKYSYEAKTVSPDGTVKKDMVKVESDAEPHNDLVEAIEAFNPHMVNICEQPSYDEIVDGAFNPYRVTGFKISPNGEDLTIIGAKIIKEGGELTLISPAIKPDRKYVGMDDLSIAIQQAIFEVEEYINGKVAPSKQIELDLDEPKLEIKPRRGKAKMQVEE